MTLKSLQKNRTRTVVTIIGIMLSVAMICAVTTSISSLLNYVMQNSVYQSGSWEGKTLGADAETLKYFKRSRKKYRATIVSLFMSVVLFVSASAFTGYLTDSVEGSFSTYGFDITYSSYRGDTKTLTPEALFSQFGNTAGVQKKRLLKRFHTL